MKKICFLMATPFTLGGEQRVVSVISSLLVERHYDVTILSIDSYTEINYNLYNLNHNVKIKFIENYYNNINLKIRKICNKMYIKNSYTGKYKNNLFLLKIMNCDPLTRKLLIKNINEEKFDYVISLSTIFNSMLAIISDKINAKTIGWQHSVCDLYFDTIGMRHYNQDKFSEYMFKKLDKYIVLTKYDQDYLKRRFNVSSIVLNNPKSVQTNKIASLKNKKFIALGRYTKIKNFSMLIDMFNEFHKKNKEWSLYIVGDGEQRELLEEKVKKYDLKEFVHLENYTENVEEYYLNGSVYLMSSLHEGWGMVLSEAIEYGLPIISFDISSAREMIADRLNGYIVEKYNQNEFINCMLKLSNNDDLRKKMGRNSKIIANQKSNNLIIDKWINLLEN